MAHLTFVPEGRDCIDLESYAAGFESKGMAQCSFLAVFWGGNGTNFDGGRAIHGSGGIWGADIDNLTNGLQGALTIVLVQGSMFDGDEKPDSLDGSFVAELQRRITAGNWTVRRFKYTANMQRFVVTRSGYLLSLSQWDQKQAFNAKLANSGRCVVM